MKYILLTPLIPSMFGMETYEEITDSLEEFGCGTIISHDPLGNTVMFATANSKDAMTNMTGNVELPGVVLGYTEVYDQAEIVS